MAYLSLYRRHRPLTFADMTGQEHITRTLSNALGSGRLAHAYLFSGPRGTGKTTVAKILARAVNCDHYPASEPCGTCTPCKNIAAGVSMDVIEMDAASNRGIDEIRELRERTRYASGENRFKVYIIDEAHMLTAEACNAFLKTLEEPPQNVIFILATTDPSRLPSTIVSRCQRFDYHLLTIDQIRQRIEQILEQEGRQSEPEAVNLMARLADGSLRDALGILEQCSSYSEDHISAEHVRIVTGATMTETIEALIRAAVENDPDSGLEIIEEVVYSGRDLQLLVRDLTFVFSRLLLQGKNEDGAKKGQCHGFEDILQAYRGRVSRDLLLEAVELLHEVGNELKHARFHQFILEVSFIRLLRVLHGRPRKEVAEGIEQPEKARLEKAQPKTAPQKQAPPQAAKSAEPEAAEPDERISAAETTGETEVAGSLSAEAGLAGEGDTGELSPESDLFARLREDWPRIVKELKKKQKSTAAWLEPARLKDLRGRLVCISYPPEYTIHQLRIMENSHRKLVEEVLTAFCHMPVNIKADLDEEEAQTGFAEDDPGSTEVHEEGVADTKENKSVNTNIYPGAPPGPGKQEPVPSEQEKPGESNSGPAGEQKKKTPPSAEEAMQLFGGKGKLIDPD